ncbi:hypothetical protein CEP53_003877 [Fusarium sp. AF-6]|nr:hypothetical protein CEP53_003877 [Fusarium sp. AF-6]
MPYQIALNGKVHPQRKKDSVQKFIKDNKIADVLSAEEVYNGATLDYLVSGPTDTETKLFKDVTQKNLPILNEEWMKQVVQTKAWVHPLEEHFISQGAVSASTSQPAADAAAKAQTQAHPAPTPPASTPPASTPPAPTTQFKIEDIKNNIASIINNAELKANETVAASNAAEDAYWKHDAETVFDQAGKASTAFSAVQEQQKLLHNYIKDSIDKLDDDLVQAASKSMSLELNRAVEAAGDADKRKTMAQVMKDDPSWGQPVIPDAETKQQQALADAQEARNAANQATTNATRLRQRADALAEKAYAIQEAARTKEGSEKDAEMQRFREMTIELPEALQNAKKAEQDAKEAEDLAVVRANDAGISSQDLQQKEQNPWGDILGSSENSIRSSSPDSISIPKSLVRGGARGKIVCTLPRGQLVVVAKYLEHFKAFILPSTFSMERKAFKDHGGLQLEYEDVESYDEDDVPDLHDLDPLLVAVQTAKATKRTVLVILIAKRHGPDDRILLYNMSRLKAIFPASEVALYLNDVRAKQDQDPVCPVTRRLKEEDDSMKKREAWKIRNNMP